MIYILIILFGLISAVIDRTVLKYKDNVIFRTVVYMVIYYCVVVAARTVLSNGTDYLSYSFYGKGSSGYIKVGILMLSVYILIVLIRQVIGQKSEKIRACFEGFLVIFAAFALTIESLCIILIGWPNMIRIVYMSVVALCISAGYVAYLCKKGKLSDRNSDMISFKEFKRPETLYIAIPFTMFSILYMIIGPMELMLYNTGDFLFSFSAVLPKLLAGTVLILIPTVILLSNSLSSKACKVYSTVVSAFCILSYLQSLLLNGKMSQIDGGEQDWSVSIKAFNILIWVVIALLMAFIAYKRNKGIKLLIWISVYIVSIQLVTGIYIVATRGVTNNNGTEQLTEDGILTLSDENNVVVFILDAYDVQMLKYVTDDDPDYLAPLHDFTYYDNMTSRYTATDGSLPYLLTGADIDDPNVEKQQDTWYEQTHFLKDIKDSGYDMRILTEKKYVEKLDEGLLDNYSKDNYCKLDAEKTLELFTRTMRYKNYPFMLKRLYKYESYDITNTITDTNIYIFGTDAGFDDKITAEGITVDDGTGALRIYHLYGAHSPYYLTEDADIDYDSTPLAQWRGSLKIVYDYIDALKAAGVYDDTTLIIMADHGFNNTQINSVRAAGLDVDEDKTNPIFILKRAGERNDELRVVDSPTSHDVFFDTIRESMGLPGTYKGAVWEQ